MAVYCVGHAGTEIKQSCYFPKIAKNKIPDDPFPGKGLITYYHMP